MTSDKFRLVPFPKTFGVFLSGNLDSGVQTWREFVKEEDRIAEDVDIGTLADGTAMEGLQDPGAIMIPARYLGDGSC